jgi:hypothetical protein
MSTSVSYVAAYIVGRTPWSALVHLDALFAPARAEDDGTLLGEDGFGARAGFGTRVTERNNDGWRGLAVLREGRLVEWGVQAEGGEDDER